MNAIGVCKHVIAALKAIYHKYRWVVVLAILFLIMAFLYFGWQNSKEPKQITYLPQQQAQSAVGVKLAADAAFVPVTKAQAREIAGKIATISTGSPERVISTTGAEVEITVASLRQAKGADFTLITNPQKPAEKPILTPDEQVKLNVYNVKAYPDKLMEVSIGAHGGDIAYLHRVNVPKVPLLLPKGAVGYAGPFVRTEYGGGRVDAGLRLVVTY